MRLKIFRVIAVLLGLSHIVFAFDAAKYAPDGFWPSWMHPIPSLVFGTILFVFGVTGRAWPRSYDDKIFGPKKDFDDDLR